MSETKTIRRFDSESWVCVHCRPNSDVVQVTSNLADEWCATTYAESIKTTGGHVFKTCKAGVLVAALQLIKTPPKPNPVAGLLEAAKEVVDPIYLVAAYLEANWQHAYAKTLREVADKLQAAVGTCESEGVA